MINDEINTKITNWYKTLNIVENKSIDLMVLSNSNIKSNSFKQFAKEFSGILPNIKVIQIKESNENLPGIMLNKNIIFNTIPLEEELEPFLKYVQYKLNNNFELSENYKLKLDELKADLKVDLFIAQICPYCPRVVEKIIPLALYNNRIKLNVIDSSLFTKLAQIKNIKSVPAILINDKLIPGTAPLDDIIDFIVSGNPLGISKQALENMLSDGNAVDVANIMLSCKGIFKNFADCLVHDTFSIRLGAMTAVEELLENDRELVKLLLPEVYKRYNSQINEVKGDLLFIIGEVGTQTDVSKLKEFDSAISCFKKVLALNPTSAIDYANIASNYRDMGNTAKAIQYYETALSIDPGIDFARDNLTKLQKQVTNP